jgi:hypothetical protein
MVYLNKAAKWSEN